jgi:hypothetical protein
MMLMLLFIKKIAVFLSLFIILIGIGVMLPQTPRASSAHLLSQRDKDLLLREAPSPRLILVGGSNISMSINSQLLYDSLKFYPINTGLSASIGLYYMLDNALQNVKMGDVVIVCPEYSQFYDNLSKGTEDLLRVVIDESPSAIFQLRTEQFTNSLKYIPKYALSKFKPSEYFFKENTHEVYLRSSFNQYGDMTTHWLLMRKSFMTLTPLIHGQYDTHVIESLKQFKRAIELKGAQLYITFPALHHQSFEQNSIEINRIEDHIRAEAFLVLGNPLRYRMPDSVMFDTPYHLTQPGVNLRTLLLIEDLKKSTLFCKDGESHD